MFVKNTFPCSSVVEHSPVKRLVVGSNPTGGARVCECESERANYFARGEDLKTAAMFCQQTKPRGVG